MDHGFMLGGKELICKNLEINGIEAEFISVKDDFQNAYYTIGDHFESFRLKEAFKQGNTSNNE